MEREGWGCGESIVLKNNIHIPPSLFAKEKKDEALMSQNNQVHVRHSTPDGAPVFTPKTELADEFEELSNGAGEKEKVIHKQHPSSFTGTDLAEHLDRLGKKKIVLAGMDISNSICYFTTYLLTLFPQQELMNADRAN